MYIAGPTLARHWRQRQQSAAHPGPRTGPVPCRRLRAILYRSAGVEAIYWRWRVGQRCAQPLTLSEHCPPTAGPVAAETGERRRWWDERSRVDVRLANSYDVLCFSRTHLRGVVTARIMRQLHDSIFILQFTMFQFRTDVDLTRVKLCPIHTFGIPRFFFRQFMNCCRFSFCFPFSDFHFSPLLHRLYV